MLCSGMRPPPSIGITQISSITPTYNQNIRNNTLKIRLVHPLIANNQRIEPTFSPNIFLYMLVPSTAVITNIIDLWFHDGHPMICSGHKASTMLP